MGGATLTTWRGVTVDPTTATYLTAVAAEVTRMTKAAGIPDFNVTPIPGCGSYQNSTAASAGTHAGGGAVDINAEGLTDKQARVLESAARKWGGTAWFRPRTSPTGYVYGWQRHVHILRSDCADLAPAASTQVRQYRAGLNGLANNGPDTGNRTWVNTTWGAVAHLAATIGKIAETVTPPATTPPEEDPLAAITLSQIVDAIWNQTKWTGADGTAYSAASWLKAGNEKAGRAESYGKQALAKATALEAAVKALADAQGQDGAAIVAAVQASVDKALDGIKVELVRTDGP